MYLNTCWSSAIHWWAIHIFITCLQLRPPTSCWIDEENHKTESTTADLFPQEVKGYHFPSPKQTSIQCYYLCTSTDETQTSCQITVFRTSHDLTISSLQVDMGCVFFCVIPLQYLATPKKVRSHKSRKKNVTDEAIIIYKLLLQYHVGKTIMNHPPNHHK